MNRTDRFGLDEEGDVCVTVTQGTVFGGTEQLVTTEGASEFSAGAGCDDEGADAGAWQSLLDFLEFELRGFQVGADPYHRSIGSNYGRFGAMLGMGIYGIGAPRFGPGRAAARGMGASLTTIDDIFANPALLAGKLPDDIATIVATAEEAGWTVTVLARGTARAGGFRMFDAGDRLISYTPLGLRHGGPYWKVSSGVGGTVRVNAQGIFVIG